MRNLLHILSHWIRCHRHCVSLIITIVSPQRLLFKGNVMGQQKTLWIFLGLKLIRQIWCLHWELGQREVDMALFYPVSSNLKWVKNARTSLNSAHHTSHGGKTLFGLLWPTLVCPPVIADSKVLLTPLSFPPCFCFSLILTGQKDNIKTSSLILLLNLLNLMWRRQIFHGVS